MIEAILVGSTTAQDVAEASSYTVDERKKLMSRLLGTLESALEEAVFTEQVMEDVSNAIRQARPVFAAGMPVDQALGFITNMIENSLSDLEEAGGADSDEYEKQESVFNMLKGFISTCEESGHTQGEEALQFVLQQYDVEKAKLDALSEKGEAGIANALSFLQDAYGDGVEVESFAHALDHGQIGAKFIGAFGSPSFFAYKHVAAPGEIAE